MSGHAQAEYTQAHDAHSHSDHAEGHGHGHAEATPLHTHFSASELRDLDDADTEAGRAIGKMLSILFVYTLIAMSIASVWTWFSIQAQEPTRGSHSPAAGHSHAEPADGTAAPAAAH